MIVVDTNALVSAFITSAPDHDRAYAWFRQNAVSLAITRQIMREYVAVPTRPQHWAGPSQVHQVIVQLESLVRPMEILEDGPAVWAELTRLSRQFVFGGKQVHDANIVATMLAHGETRLLTFNVRDFRRFDTLIEIIEP